MENKPKNIPVRTIDEYIEGFPSGTQKILHELRDAIKKAAPQAEECISYAIPTFKLKGNLVHFAGYKNHIGFYPAPSAIAAFEEGLSGYKKAKGSVQFPIDQALPLELIARIVAFRIEENLKISEGKK